MSTILRILLTLALFTIASATTAQQRRVTPVAPPSGINQNPSANDRSNLLESIDSQGNVIFIDTIAGQEVPDTIVMTKVISMQYPLLESLIIGVNLWDGAMRLLGQQYGLTSVRAQLSLHNRYIPTLEFGMGNADDTPDGMNYTFRSKPAPFLKLGLSYNIFYNSNPDYQLVFGIRYGVSHFSYAVDNVTVDEGYWNDPAHFSLPQQSVTSGYLEAGLGIKVKIARPISLGWDIMYHSIIHESRNRYGRPMIIPGYGKRQGAFTGAFYVMYTLPLSKRSTPPPAP